MVMVRLKFKVMVMKCGYLREIVDCNEYLDYMFVWCMVINLDI